MLTTLFYLNKTSCRYNIFTSRCLENQKKETNLKALKTVQKEENISIHKPRKDQPV